jgi:hypothetical protein
VWVISWILNSYLTGRQTKDQLQKQREEEKRKEEEREKLRQEEDARREKEMKAQEVGVPCAPFLLFRVSVYVGVPSPAPFLLFRVSVYVGVPSPAPFLLALLLHPLLSWPTGLPSSAWGAWVRGIIRESEGARKRGVPVRAFGIHSHAAHALVPCKYRRVQASTGG